MQPRVQQGVRARLGVVCCIWAVQLSGPQCLLLALLQERATAVCASTHCCRIRRTGLLADARCLQA